MSDEASNSLAGTQPERATVLIVDDAPENLLVLGDILAPDYRVKAAISGPRALQLARMDPRPDLILLDIMMPDMDGYTVIQRLKADPETADIPVMFVTARDDVNDEERGFALGAVDYLTKPIKPVIVLARVRAHLEVKQARDILRHQNMYLEAEVARRMQETLFIQDVSIRALARLAEVRDLETGNHLLRTQAYVNALARRLSDHPRFSSVVTPRYIDLLTKSAPLHDIGKVGIPDTILLKQGPLTADEWTVMKTHAKLGSDALESAERDAERPIEFLAIAKEVARHHHERWDGTGYPDGLRGDAIPVSARLMAIADVFDALISRRVYKEPIPVERSFRIIVDGRGTHFDPDVVDAFVVEREAFVNIAQKYIDTEETIRAKTDRIGNRAA